MVTGQDIASILTLALLEGLLSADNAIVLAIIARRLPEPAAQSRALTLGVALSFGLRVIALAFAAAVIHLWYLRAAGSLYLLYLTVTHFVHTHRHRGDAAASPNTEGESVTEASVSRSRLFLKTVLAMTFTDVAFAVDSILVAVAITKRVYVIYVGVALGIIGLRVLSGTFLRLLERYPTLEHMAFALVGWAGIKLGIEAFDAYVHSVLHRQPAFVLPESAFWIGTGIIIAVGVWFAVRRPNKGAPFGKG